jgi:hypothetical protein
MRFRQWNLNKNVTKHIMRKVLDIRRHRELHGKNTQFRFKGRIIPKTKIDRFEKRQVKLPIETQFDSREALTTFLSVSNFSYL